MSTRPATLRLHRWAGLGTALFLVVAALTGSVLAYKNELEVLINPRLFAVEPPPRTAADQFLDPFVLRERVQELYPQARADHFTFPRAGQSQMFFLMPRVDPATQRPYPMQVDQVFLNPYTGELLGARKWGELFSQGQFHKENIVPFVWRLHEAFALPHPWGKALIGLIALFWTIDCFVGVLLTLPRKAPFFRKWRVAWQVKHTASRRRLNFDLHRAGALWLWITLLVFAWSSVMLNTREYFYQPVMSVLFTFEDERPPDLSQPNPSPRLEWREAHQRARHTLEAMARKEGFEISGEDSMWYRPGLGAYLYRTSTSLDLRDDGVGASDLWIDGDTGAVLKARFEQRAASGDAVSHWLRVLHTGQIWGLAYRTLVAVLGVLITGLTITGVLIWYLKRRSRRRAALESAEPAGATVTAATHSP